MQKIKQYKDINLDLINTKTINNIKFSFIKPSDIHGLGLFTNSMIKKGTILGFLDGQVMPWAQYNEIMKNTDLGYFNSYIFMEWNALDKNTLLVRAFRTKYSYINQSRKPNVAIKYNPMRVEAIKDITKNNEILIDYRKEPLNDNYIKNYGKEFL